MRRRTYISTALLVAIFILECLLTDGSAGNDIFSFTTRYFPLLPIFLVAWNKKIPLSQKILGSITFLSTATIISVYVASRMSGKLDFSAIYIAGGLLWWSVMMFSVLGTTYLLDRHLAEWWHLIKTTVSKN